MKIVLGFIPNASVRYRRQWQRIAAARWPDAAFEPRNPLKFDERSVEQTDVAGVLCFNYERPIIAAYRALNVTVLCIEAGMAEEREAVGIQEPPVPDFPVQERLPDDLLAEMSWWPELHLVEALPRFRSFGVVESVMSYEQDHAKRTGVIAAALRRMSELRGEEAE